MGPSDLYNKANELGLQFTEGYDQSVLPAFTFKSRQAGSPPTFLSYTINRVRRSNVDDQELLMRGLLSVTTQWFHIPQAALDNATGSNGVTIQAPDPKPDDEFVDSSGITWVINDSGVKSLTFNGQTIEHSCMASKEVT